MSDHAIPAPGPTLPEPCLLNTNPSPRDLH